MARLYLTTAGAVEVFTFPSRLREIVREAGFLEMSGGLGAEGRGALLREVGDFLSFLGPGNRPAVSWRYLLAEPGQAALPAAPGSSAASRESGSSRTPGKPARRGGGRIAVFNLSDEPSSVVLCNLGRSTMRGVFGGGRGPESVCADFLRRFPQYPLVKVVLQAGEGCFLAANDFPSGLCTEGAREVGVHLVVTLP